MPSLQLTSLVLFTLCPIILGLPSPVYHHWSSHSSNHHHRRFAKLTEPKSHTDTNDATAIQSPQNLTTSSDGSYVPVDSSASTTYTPITADEKFDLTKASTWEELEHMAEAQISASVTTLPTTVQLGEVTLADDDFLEECEDEEEENYTDGGSVNPSDANSGEDNHGQTASNSVDDWTEVPLNTVTPPPSPSKDDQSNAKDNSVVKGTLTVASQKADQDAASKKAKDDAATKASKQAQQAQKKSENDAAKKKSEDDAAQKQSDEEAAQKKADADEAKKEADAKKKADEEYAQKQSDEADAKQKSEDDQAKKDADEAAAEAKKQADDQAKKDADEAAAEAKKQADEEQAKQSADQAEAKKKADKQAKKDAAAAQAKADESKDKDQGPKGDGSSDSYAAPSDSYAGSGGDQKSGDATYYGTGLGACGITNNDSDYICAVSKLLFDTFPAPGGNPNLNAICGRKIRATYKGKTVTVTVTDRCEACAKFDLDFAPTAFDQIGNRDQGRLSGMTWEWA